MCFDRTFNYTSNSNQKLSLIFFLLSTFHVSSNLLKHQGKFFDRILFLSSIASLQNFPNFLKKSLSFFNINFFTKLSSFKFQNMTTFFFIKKIDKLPTFLNHPNGLTSSKKANEEKPHQH